MRRRFASPNPESISVLRTAERSSYLEEIPPMPVQPNINRKLSKLIRGILIEQEMGFQGLLRIDNYKFIDKIMYEMGDKGSSASSQVSSSGSYSYLPNRFQLEDITAKYHSELRNQLKSI